MKIEDQMRAALVVAFDPSRLEIHNESSLHAGHAGDDGSGESHFRIEIRAPAFAAMSRLERHRAVHNALGTAITGRIHALALDIG